MTLAPDAPEGDLPDAELADTAFQDTAVPDTAASDTELDPATGEPEAAAPQHSLTNLATGHAFELTVDSGQDVGEAARARLAAEGLPLDAQHGFYVSVFPTA